MSWTRSFFLVLMVSIVVSGCHSSAASTFAISPLTPTVLVNSIQQFSVGGGTNTSASVIWSVNGTTGGTTTVGTIDSTGLYTAPAVVPANTTITVAAAQGSDNASTTVTLDSGVRLSITPSSINVATGESFPFGVTVTGVPTNAAISGTCSNSTNIPVPCTAVTWSVTTGTGTIGASTGVFKAPSVAETDTITAKSVYDTNQTAIATVTVATATAPTITSISPTTGAAGAPFENVYLTGTNFIATTNVFINGSQLSPQNVTVGSGTTLLVQVPDVFLTTPQTLTFSIASQNGTATTCTNPAQCQLAVSSVRPAVVGTTPDSIPQATGTTTFNANGGYFGTSSNPTVATQFAGQPAFPSISAADPDRQLNVTISGSNLSTPGLFPFTVLQRTNQAPGAPRAAANIAVQPQYSQAPDSTILQAAGSPLAVGTSPSAVAINAATGVAVVANQGSGDITLISLCGTLTTSCATATPTVVVASLCTGSVGTASAPCTVASGPVAVAVDDVRNIALVANAGVTPPTIAVVNLSTRTVTAIIASSPTATAGIPAAIGINPVSGTALVAYRTSGYAAILDLTQSPPVFTGIASISNGPSPHISVSTKLNWALVTPGGLGTFSAVDLGQQQSVPIALSGSSPPGVSCTAGIVTVTTTKSFQALLQSQSVLISGVADSSFNGVFTVQNVVSNNSFTYAQSSCVTGHTSGAASAGSATVNTAQPVVTLATNQTVAGVAFNSQTDKAILLDPTSSTAAILNALDQTSSSLTSPFAVGNAAAAFNSLANIAVIVNNFTNQAAVIDPTTPTTLGTFATGNNPVDVAIDPGTNTAVIVNQNTSGTVSIVSLGTVRQYHVLEVAACVQTVCNTNFGLPLVVVGSTLASPVGGPGSPALNPVTLKIVGTGFSSGTPVVRLDGAPLATSFVNDRQITATVPTSMQMGPRLYTLDVTNGSTVSNAATFTVVQSVNVTGNCSTTPSPQGVAIDPQNNLAVVTDLSCNNLYLLNLATGTGPAISVGNNPMGVDVLPSASLAVVANFTDNTASIVDEIGQTVITTVSGLASPTGVAIDQLLGTAAVTSAGSNVVDLISLSSCVPSSCSPGTPGSVSVQQSPGAIAVNPVTHVAAVANAAGNSVSLVSVSAQSVVGTITGVTLPDGVAFDPISSNFLVTSSLSNSVSIINPGTQTSTALRVGVNPTSIAYNPASSTLVTMNALSNTMTVVDFVDQKVRTILSVAPSSQFSVAIHPFTNLAVVADATHGRVLFLPLPR